MTARKYPFNAIPKVGDIESFFPEGKDIKLAMHRVARAAWCYCRQHGGRISVKTLGHKIFIVRMA